ncbi:MAG TPA: hypothetical protein DCX07_15280, partial [Phycisphaerales bacterium]|nr:hypothetical protein [Phycisphaerales bacterium]
MELTQRERIRLADRIHHQLRQLRTGRLAEGIRRTGSLREVLERLGRTSRLLDVCLDRNWFSAGERMTDRLVQGLRDLPHYAGQIVQGVEAGPGKIPTLRDILEDLEQAGAEFGTLRYDAEGDQLVVTTEAIELEDVYLGEFEIRLSLDRLSECQAHRAIYRVVALDPHPAAANEHVTHPHVSDERLCEGDAGAAIEAALVHGRLCDFFQLVTAVLTTYNPSSPYVALTDWEGRPCHDCGCTMGADETHGCGSCEEEYCDECISYCRRCDETVCRGCLEDCGVCGEPVCPSCLTRCPDCGERLCRTCLEQRQCPCLEETDNPEPPEQDNDHDREPA